MAEDLDTITGSKEEKYESLMPQVKGLLTGEHILLLIWQMLQQRLKNNSNGLRFGFYVAKNDELVLAPFQGPVACTRIKKGW